MEMAEGDQGRMKLTLTLFNTDLLLIVVRGLVANRGTVITVSVYLGTVLIFLTRYCATAIAT